MSTPQLSVVIATKNEEKNIRECLESIRRGEWVDEIIVVDDVSTDKTVEICREYTDKIFVNDSKGSFHKNKNLGIEKAIGEWILSIDADERVGPELAEEIRKAITKSEKVGYYISRKNYFLGKWIKGCGWYPDYIIRLLRKGATKWPLNIHDTPFIEEKERVGYLKNSLIHISYTTLDQYFRKFAQYTSRLAQEEYEKGIRITSTNCFIFFIIKPLYWFFRKYFLLHGYTNGFRGFFISFSSALTIFMTYAKLWEMQQKNRVVSEFISSDF